ncbi:hypothetical protein AMECASPLE_033340, partial [Ameca splendens]
LNFVNMIADSLTLLDPVDELCLFVSKETLARCASPVPVVNIVEEIGFIRAVASWEVRCYPPLAVSEVAGSIVV